MKKPPKANGPPASGVVPIIQNAGLSLFNHANNYETVSQVLEEIVQNMVDPDVAASEISIKVNEKDRSLTVTDNGKGVSHDTFRSRLATVCGQHRKGLDATGKFGIGMMSPLGKCERFFLISCPEPEVDQYLEFRFECEQIRESPGVPQVPFRARPELRFGAASGRGIQPVHWRTMVRLEKITKDRSISHVDLDRLVERILVAHGNKMRRFGTKISVSIVRENGQIEERKDIQAPVFRGEPLEEFNTSHPKSGEAVFRLFQAPLRTRNASERGVVVGQIGDDHRLPLATLLRQIEKKGLDPKAAAALKSGVFEGELLFAGVSLHQDRLRFLESEALDGVAVSIGRWFVRVGAKAYEQAQEARQDTRNVERAERSLTVIERLMERFPEIVKNLNARIKLGSVGFGHSPIPKRRVAGEVHASSINGKHGVGGGGSSNGSKTRSSEPQERAGHTPLTIEGPKSPARKLVRGGSIGLCVAHDTLEGDALWNFDPLTGTMTFNVQHPVWANAEDQGGDKAVCSLQEFCILELVVKLGQPENAHEPIARFSQQMEPLALHWILNGNALRPKASK